MKVLVIGSGAREHTLVWKISQSSEVTKIYCAPGNAGISELAECVNIKAEDMDMLLSFALKEEIDITVVGPEAPLVNGIVDKFTEKGLEIFGPNMEVAQLEGSKIYAKEFMLRHKIPTAKYESFDNTEDAQKSLENFNYPLVIKADGLAAGKGVVICANRQEATDTIKDMISNKKFGEAGLNIVIEEFLEGTEASLLCFVAGNKIIPMESARDYKQVYDNDEGPNTGGMGCFSPNNILTEEVMNEITREVLDRIEVGLEKEDLGYSGILFIGFMITKDGPKVLEFNVRMGDPETEVVLPRLKNDIVDVIKKVMDETLTKSCLSWSKESCMCVIAASGGYPIKYEKGKLITGLKDIEDDVIIFHGGTKMQDGEVYTNGGRVLAITCLGDNLELARQKVYENIKRISYVDMYYRKDIGKI